ncbi:two-component sensor histidine kinase [Kitasatospora sp. NA04385]|uniref:sensor histidine kinase n=1 Tax=Kitasatospora sp. NA04385 TaxID=2742135 RepID=UPI00158FF3E6|nr:histidine kinase [Kitasatospora sp. NA04385]QKW17873.1 two-component sensor histidine kinase [Kitasatospora sp. NA04385]
MTWAIGPFLRGSTYTGALFAFLGAAASLLLLPFAVLPALLWESGPYGARAALVAALWAGLVALVGTARSTRRVLVAAARRMLDVPLPAPAAPVGASEASGASGASGAFVADRRRTGLWLLLHVAAGWAAGLTANLLLAALALPGRWLGGELELSFSGRTVRSGDGWASWAAALGCVLLAVLVCAAVSSVLRRLAPRLLGPSPAERLALAVARERRLAERNRLATELHDSIGHTLTAATIQAAVAGEVLTGDPVAARAALRSIEESTRAALEDLDHVLGVLREEAAGTAPARTLADLPDLLERLRHAGTEVEAELTDDLAGVPGAVSRAAYRILQEGATNALRHGADGPVRVTAVLSAAGLELAVANRTGRDRGGRSAGFPSSGHGLPGLAERVRLLDGEFRAGPDGADHWVLAARLPVRTSG